MQNLFRIIADIAMAHEIRQDEQRRRKCKRFGIASIVFSIFIVPLALLAVLSLGWMQGDGALLFIFIIALLAIGIGGTLIMLVNAVIYFFLQLSVNRKPITWIALFFLVVSIAAAVLVCMQFM